MLMVQRRESVGVKEQWVWVRQTQAQVLALSLTGYVAMDTITPLSLSRYSDNHPCEVDGQIRYNRCKASGPVPR